jgi:glutamate--cysteine ligase
MSNLGYKSEAQKSLFVCYNDLETYVDCLHEAIHTPYEKYSSIGQYSDGEYRQINTNLLQLENEFYSTVRPKRNVKPGEKPLEALTNSGIEYIEVRALDLDPYSPLGINEEQIRFLDSFLLHCLLADSPDCNENEFFEVGNNVNKVVEHGRNSKLMLDKRGTPKNIKEWSHELIENISYSAGLLDSVHQTNNYYSSLITQEKKIDNPSLTPSGRMLSEMQEENLSFYEFSIKQSRTHHQTLSNAKLDQITFSHMQKMSNDSLAKQKMIEDSDTTSFEEFLNQWNET